LIPRHEKTSLLPWLKKWTNFDINEQYRLVGSYSTLESIMRIF
jgi:hypothetical protein